MKSLDRKTAESVVAHLRRLAASNDGKVPSSAVAAHAEAHGVTTRTIWRYLSNGIPRDADAPPLTEPHLEAVATAHGHLKHAWQRLCSDGLYAKSYRQFVRDFRRLDPMLQQGLRHGVKAGMESGLFLRSQPESRLDRVIFDHTEADIRLQRVHAGVREMFRPWISLLIDSGTRMILAAVITEGDGLNGDPNTESLVALMGLAIRGHEAADGTFVGGVPRLVQCDNAKAHLAEAMMTGFISLGIGVNLIKPGTPWEDGKVERLMRTMKEDFLSPLPGFTGALQDRYSHEPWAAEDCFTIDEFTTRLLAWIDTYNYERQHSSLGCTPFEAWRDDPEPIERVDDALIRSSFLAQSRQVTVSKNGVRFRKVDYIAKELKPIVGKKVSLRYLPNDPSFVDVYLDDIHLCTAKPHSRLTQDERRVIVMERQSTARKVDRLVKKSRKRRQEAELSGNPLMSPQRDPSAPLDYNPPKEIEDDFLTFGERLVDPARSKDDNSS